MVQAANPGRSERTDRARCVPGREIHNVVGTLAPNAGAGITGNNTGGEGDGLNNTGVSVTLAPGSNVSASSPYNCVNDSGGTGCP
jgi:hypothetical protein